MQLLFAESSIKGWGTEQHFAALAIAMAQRGHAVRCLMCSGSPLEAVLRAAAVPVTVARFGGGADPRLLQVLGRLQRQRHAEWLISNDGKFYWPLLLMGRLTGARTALFRHWPNMPKSVLTRGAVPRLADRFILVSRFQREHLRAQGIDVSRMPILYNPIDTQQLRPETAAREHGRAALGALPGQVLIGYVGRMVADKGIFTLLAAAGAMLEQTAAAHLVWVGEGADLSALRARIEHSPQRARHSFARWSADVRAIYAALDMVVVPSQYPDPCPRVPVEAQACGTPVICSDAGGLPETLAAGRSGLLVAQGDAAALSAAMLELALDAPLRQRMGRAGREFACERFSFARIAQDFEALLAGPRTSLA